MGGGGFGGPWNRGRAGAPVESPPGDIAVAEVRGVRTKRGCAQLQKEMVPRLHWRKGHRGMRGDGGGVGQWKSDLSSHLRPSGEPNVTKIHMYTIRVS